MSSKAYLNILRYGIYASLFTVFLVFRNLLFPYITSKQITFNIIVELLMIFWLALVVKYPEYRPKKSYITFGLTAFFSALLLSCFTSVDFNLSFWGDIERMLGVFHVLHFLAFYFIIITVFRQWRDWKILFLVSTVIAIFVSFIGLNQNKFSTIGNTAYVSGYLIFNMYFCALLFFREKNKTLRWLYLLPLPLYFFAFRRADTTGAFAGLGFSIILLLLMYGILGREKINSKVKISAVLLAIIMFSFATYVIVNRKSAFVVNNPVLGPIAAMNFQRVTFQTRLISWRGALKDFKNHPLLGIGHGNYAVIFDKYFSPTFFDYTRSETYFDRAHNNIVDIASTSGLIGLVTYLSIFIATAYYLIIGYRRGRINLNEFILISCLIIAYFIQNLAVFDSSVTYIAIMITLAYVYWLSEIEGEEEEEEARGLENSEIYSFAIFGVIILIIMWQYNIKVYKMLDLTIAGQIAWSQGGADASINTYEVYKKAMAYNTPLDRDSITSYNRLLAGSPNSLKNIDKNKALEILDYNIELAEKVVKYNPGDSLNQMMLAQILDITSYYYADNPEKFTYYSNRALEAIDKSIAASPGRIPVYYQKAQILMNRGEKDKVFETLKYAISLNEKYYDSACHLAMTYLYYKQENDSFQYFDKCIDMDGMDMISPSSLAMGLINRYQKINDTGRVIKLYKRLIALEPKEAKYLVTLAQLYAQEGKKDLAIEAATKAGEVNPSIKQYADEFIKKLQ